MEDKHGRNTKPIKDGKVSPIKKGRKVSVGGKVGEKLNDLKNLLKNR